jgi:hypothetical protein
VRADEVRRLLQGYSFLAWMRWQGLVLSAATERHVDHAAFMTEVADRRTAAAQASMSGNEPCAATRGLPWHARNLPAQYPFCNVAECMTFCFASKAQPRVDGSSWRAQMMLYFLWDCGLSENWQVRPAMIMYFEFHNRVPSPGSEPCPYIYVCVFGSKCHMSTKRVRPLVRLCSVARALPASMAAALGERVSCSCWCSTKRSCIVCAATQ